MATARSQMRLSKPGEPEIILPGGTSCETADCAVRMTPSPTVQWPAMPTWPARITLLPMTEEPARPVCAQSSVFVADARAVAHLDEVVDLGAVADFGGAHRGAVDGGVGLHVHAVADAHRAGLRNFFPVALFVFGKAEAVGADDGAVFKRDVVAEDAVLAHHRVRVGEEVAAGLDAGIEHHVGQERGVGAEADVGADDGIGADVRVRRRSRPWDR